MAKCCVVGRYVNIYDIALDVNTYPHMHTSTIF